MRTSWSIEIMEANRGREKKGIYTVESQNSTVQEAYLRQALADSSPALIVTSADMLDPHERSGKNGTDCDEDWFSQESALSWCL